MSNVAQSKYRRWYRTFLRWFVLVVAIVTIAGSLARFYFSLNAQLSGQSMGQVATGGVWVFRTVCFERVVLSSPGCLWPGRMDDHEEVLEAHA